MTDQDNTPARPAEPTPGQVAPQSEPQPQPVEAQAPGPSAFSSLFTPVVPPTPAPEAEPEDGEQWASAGEGAPAEGAAAGAQAPGAQARFEPRVEEAYQGFSDLFTPRVPPAPVAPVNPFERPAASAATPEVGSLFAPVVPPVAAARPDAEEFAPSIGEADESVDAGGDQAPGVEEPAVEGVEPEGFDTEGFDTEGFDPGASQIAGAADDATSDELQPAPEPAPEPEASVVDGWEEPEHAQLAQPEPAEPEPAQPEPAAPAAPELTPFSWEELVRGATARVEAYRPEPVVQQPLPAHPPQVEAWAQPAVPLAEPVEEQVVAPIVEPAVEPPAAVRDVEADAWPAVAAEHRVEPTLPAQPDTGLDGDARADGDAQVADVAPAETEDPSPLSRPAPQPAPWLLEDDYEDDLLTPRAPRPEPTAGPSWHDLIRGAETTAEATSPTASDAARDESWPWADTGPMPVAAAAAQFAPPQSAAAAEEAPRAEEPAAGSVEEPADPAPEPRPEPELPPAVDVPVAVVPDDDPLEDAEPALTSEVVAPVPQRVPAPSFDDLLVGGVPTVAPVAAEQGEPEDAEPALVEPDLGPDFGPEQDDDVARYLPPVEEPAAAEAEDTPDLGDATAPAESLDVPPTAAQTDVEAPPAPSTELFINWLAAAAPAVQAEASAPEDVDSAEAIGDEQAEADVEADADVQGPADLPAADEPVVESDLDVQPEGEPEVEPEIEPEAEGEREADAEGEIGDGSEAPAPALPVAAPASPAPDLPSLPPVVAPVVPSVVPPVVPSVFAPVVAPAIVPGVAPVAADLGAPDPDQAAWFGRPAEAAAAAPQPSEHPVAEPEHAPEPEALTEPEAPVEPEAPLEPEPDPQRQPEVDEQPAREVTAALRELAGEYGVATEFWDWQGQHRPVSHRTLVAVLKAMDVEASTDADVEASLAAARERSWSRTLPPIVVVRQGKAAEVAVHVPHGQTVEVDVVQEDGERVRLRQIDRWVDPRLVSGRLVGEATFALPADLPLGWHTIAARSAQESAQTPLVVSPDVLALPPALREDRAWGYMVQLYSLRSRSSWGLGDLADLSELATWSAREQGAGFVLINPLHAAEPIAPMTPSPYLPTTRRFANPIYLRVEDIREVGYLAATDRAILEWHAEAMRAMNTLDAELDRDSVWAAKRSALETVFAYPRSPAREVAFRAFVEREGQGLLDFATWCALAERYGLPAHRWPEHARNPHSPAVAQLREELADRIEFHMWLQWCLDEQLATVQRQAREAGMPIGVIADLAVGVHPDGAEPWALQGTMAHHVSVGAPPDAFNQQGQDWSQPPWRPDRLAEAAYAPYRDMLRTLLRHSGGIRVDHILGLFRLWWIPNGQGPEGGTYVRYDHEAMVGILALEAHRAGALVVGEDLGTVEPWVRDYLRDRGVLGTSVAWWERGDGGRPLRPEQWRELCLATVTTHDLPPTAGYLAGEHIEVRSRLGLLTRSVEEETRIDEADREQVLGQLRELGLLSADASERERVEALHRFLKRTPAKLLGVALPDAVGDRRAMNQPGTNDEYPNWRLPLADGVARPVLLEDLMASARAASLGEVMNE